jgi:hypothetical protein
VSAILRAARETRALGRELAVTAGGTALQKIAYAALIILMLGVTSGLVGGP